MDRNELKYLSSFVVMITGAVAAVWFPWLICVSVLAIIDIIHLRHTLKIQTDAYKVFVDATEARLSKHVEKETKHIGPTVQAMERRLTQVETTVAQRLGLPGRQGAQ